MTSGGVRDLSPSMPQHFFHLSALEITEPWPEYSRLSRPLVKAVIELTCGIYAPRFRDIKGHKFDLPWYDTRDRRTAFSQ
mmetsp:Transcript_10109/g.32530  ORF Transcript_10109/g.32530 Transcript_10109/m.32530 type:complete len:80 (+) Transcript_10109:967-1206(+)